MISATVVKALENFLPTENIYLNEPMSRHTTFRIGGNADVLVAPQNLLQIQLLFAYIKENSIPYTVIGNGSNVTISWAYRSAYGGVYIEIYQINW